MEYKIIIDPNGFVGTALNLHYHALFHDGGTEILIVEGVPDDITSMDVNELEDLLLQQFTKKYAQVVAATPGLKLTVHALNVVTMACAKGTVNGRPIMFNTEIARSPLIHVDGTIMERSELVLHYNSDLTALNKFPNNCKGLKLWDGRIIQYIEGTTLNIQRVKQLVG